MTDVLVLCYHAVSRTWPAPHSVAPETFEGQLASLVRRGYRGATFSDAITAERPGKTVAVTFDDAYRSVFELARPILDELGLPGTVFVPTAYPGSERPMAWPGVEQWMGGPHERELIPMSWEELTSLAEEGWEIGSHTHTHPRLPELDHQALHAELTRSRSECEERLGKACRSLAYPYGDHSPDVVAATIAAGYETAGAVSGRVRTPHAHLWPRDGIYREDGPFRFRLKVSPHMRRLRASRVWRARFLARRVRR